MTRETILQLLESVQAGATTPAAALQESGAACRTKMRDSRASITIARCGWDCRR